MHSTPFLKEIATLLLQPGAYDLPSTCVVFPNKRARLYLSKYIGELTDKPVWAPKYLTISELMEKISGYLYADRLTLLFEIYDVYSKATGSKESFDAFYPYSETLLADFDELDKYLIDAADLFGNLSGLKSLDGRFNYLSDEQVNLIRRFWSTFSPEKLSEGQELFISLWEALPVIYNELRSKLQSRQMAYEGMAYRQAIDNLDKGINSKELEYRQYLFVGFNALNTCEEKLFRYLKNLDKAGFFWDYDSWYTNNEIHEAGYFIRKNLKNFPQTKSVNHDNLITGDKKVLFIPVSSNSAQAGILPQVFDKFGINDPAEAEQTALVLADESLLITTLYVIPESVSGVNITMGYPVSGSAVFNLIDSLYELIKNSKAEKSGSVLWYFKDVLAIMGNPMLKNFYSIYIEIVRKKVLQQHLIYLSTPDILEDRTEDFIFSTKIPEDVCSYLLQILSDIIRQSSAAGDDSGIPDPVQTETLFQVYMFLTRLQDTLSTQHIFPGTGVIFRLIRKMMRSMHIPFSGEPLAGLQVLGLLETRTLDFKNVIVLSANEGILPKASDLPSFIPYNLRSGFGLPVPEHHDSIYAYYFYRLIQRAQNIALVYDNSSGGLRTGERSRFLHQLHYETHLPISEMVIESTIAQLPVKSIIINKTADIERALSGFTGEDGRILSPSALNEFLNCSLRFYFHHIADLPQPDEVAEDIDARMFGNILHGALKDIYADFGKSVITREMLELVLKNEQLIDNTLDKAFNEELFGDSKNTGGRKPEGFNLIVRQVIRTYIRQFLTAELESCPLTIISLEERHKLTIPLVVNEKKLDIRLGGVIDRIDNYRGKTRILDYKTGLVKRTFTSIESLFGSGEKLRNDGAFQVLLYSYIYDSLHPGNIITPGLLFMRNSHAGDFSGSLQMGPKKSELSHFETVKPEFEELLKENLRRLFDLNEPFIQTDNMQVCRYCAYATICRRGNYEL